MLLNLCHEFNVNRGVFCLSSCIFPPQPKSFPMKEEYICDSPHHIHPMKDMHILNECYTLCANITINNMGELYLCFTC